MTSMDQTLRELKPGDPYRTVTRIVPSGSLQARRQRDGVVVFVWRYSITQPDGKEKEFRESIGLYDPRLPVKSLKPAATGYSAAAAVRAAEALAQRHREHRAEGGLPGLKAREQAAKVQAYEARTEAAKHTLAALMEAYAELMKARGRAAYGDVRSLVKCHIEQPWPKLAASPANQTTPEDVADIVRSISDAGKTRSANKLRSYLRAAYEVAKTARTDASVPASFKAFNIRTNPVAETRAIKMARPVIRALTLQELTLYWRIIKDAPGKEGAMLRLQLWTGGQRIDQLVRLKPTDIEADAVTLWDKKGRPGEGARVHRVPLIAPAQVALAECARFEGPWALTTDEGKTHVSATTLSGWSKEAVGDQIAGFATKMLRAGVETLLAANGVSKEVRGRLQSHGVTGVQDRHYNAHEYLQEKREALELLHRLIEPPPQKKKKKPAAKNVTPITAARRRAA